MKRLLAITAVMLGQSAMAGWYTGYELNGFAESHEKISNGTSDINTDRHGAGIFFGFVLGVTSTLEGQGFLCLPSSMRAGQITAIVAKFLKKQSGNMESIGRLDCFFKYVTHFSLQEIAAPTRPVGFKEGRQ